MGTPSEKRRHEGVTSVEKIKKPTLSRKPPMPYPYNLSLVALISAAAAAWHLSSPTGGNVDWAQEDTRPSPPLQPLKYFCEVTDDVTVCRGVVEQAPAYLPGDVGDKRKEVMIQSNVNELCNLSYVNASYDLNTHLAVTSMKDSNGSSLVQVVTYDCDKTTLQNKYDEWVLPVNPSGPMGPQVVEGSNLTLKECMVELAKKASCQWVTYQGRAEVQMTSGVANNPWQFMPRCHSYLVPVTNDFCPRHLNNSQATARICGGHICSTLEKEKKKAIETNIGINR